MLPDCGDFALLNGIRLEPSMFHRVVAGGITVATFTTSRSGEIPWDALFIIPKLGKNANLLLDATGRVIKIQQSLDVTREPASAHPVTVAQSVD